MASNDPPGYRIRMQALSDKIVATKARRDGLLGERLDAKRRLLCCVRVCCVPTCMDGTGYEWRLLVRLEEIKDELRGCDLEVARLKRLVSALYVAEQQRS